MRALVLEGPGQIASREDVPDPAIEETTDAVIAVEAAGLCGSDLHPYRGHEAARAGIVPGHEAVGRVLAVGDAVQRVSPGDRVLAAFTTSCLACGPCRRGVTGRCIHSRLFGWGDPAESGAVLHGAQAEQLRVPNADGTLVPVPEGIDAHQALLLTDNLPTGWEAVERTRLVAGAPLVVVGLGAVGLCAVHAARAQQAGPIIAVDPVVTRREQALALGATEAVAPDDIGAALAAQTGDRQAPAVIEAAGSRSGQRLAFEVTAPGGVLSIIAVQTAERFAFDPVEAYDRTLTIAAGRASVRATLDTLLPHVVDGEVTVPADAILTHPDLPLSAGPQIYERFAGQTAGIIKASFRP